LRGRILLLAWLLAGCRDRAAGETVEEAREGIMGTRVTVKVWVPGGSGWHRRAAEGIDAAFAEAVEVEKRMSPRDPASTVSRINAAAGKEAVEVDPWTWKVLEASVEASRATRGAFDPTWAALADLWDFAAVDPAPPSREDVEARLGLVGVRGLVMDPGAKTVKLTREGMRIGLGGSAKGFALDRMAAALKERGLEDFICYAGGDLFVAGEHGSRPWKLGIQHPRRPGAIFASYTVDGPAAVVTSGDYERFFMKRGKRYHHILDPATGFPAEGTVSVTVIASTGLWADALATGLFVLGWEEGLEIVEKMGGIEAVIVDDEGLVHCSESLCGEIEMKADDLELVQADRGGA